MSTHALLHELRSRGADSDNAVEILHALLDDNREDSASPVGVSEAGALVGLAPSTLRYYETVGLVSPSRDAGGRRVYSTFDLRRLVFLTRMRVSGMGMRELKRYVDLVEAGSDTIDERRAIMLAQQDRIRTRIAELELALHVTSYKIQAYDGHPEQGE